MRLIADAYRRAGQAPQAVFLYKAYLREVPGAPDRAEVEGFIADLGGQP
jgi:hypothetical protein